jgi:hypothetical protein
MRNLASPSLFRVVDLLLGKGNPTLKRSHWSYGDVACERERHSYSGLSHSFAIEVMTLTRPGRHGWKLMVVKEFWWAGNHGRETRNTHWAQLLSGNRNDALAWLREQEKILDRDLERIHAAVETD